ncbi:MAG: hypothetical protein HFP77_08545 [Methylococcales symbiont of Iophon sp. n. MRB-2018]|nr:MAG: hypothetical protein HFP77_08545 [Methylococcales symbiont of Iophon sp. n. MRB-2018]KAF3979747.1 MAG: hypothetical protein HFP76_05855 [Methylococcales symbiont of Iophon sp. n. MRB-2018]
MKTILLTSVKIMLKKSVLLAVLFSSSIASATDQELLDTLFQNGVLNKIQYNSLSKKTAEKEAEQAAKAETMSPAITKALDWATRIKLSGDFRFRHENIDKDDPDGVHESRQRIRARLKVATKINDNVDVGFRLVTGGGKTSTNQSLEGSFTGKKVFFDRAYLSWNPSFANGLTTTFGKFKQPWYNASSHGLLWDSDVNPEGVALIYKTTVGSVDLIATGGYFILEDGDSVKEDAENDGFSDDLNMYHAGISGSMQITDSIKGRLGSNAYIYNNESEVGEFKDDDAIEIYEVASRFDFDTALLPLYVYAQYAKNVSAKDGEDSAWLAGFGAKLGAFKMDYNYRDTQEFAVANTFNDSDFATGNIAARGHKVKLAYAISKNFAAAMAYYAAEEYSGTNIDTLQLDLKAKF